MRRAPFSGGKGRRRRQFGRRRGKAIAAPWDRDDISIAPVSVTERATQGRNMDREVVLHDVGVRPNPLHQLVLADQFAGSFHQRDQYVQGSAPQAKRMVAGEKQPSRRK